MDDFEKRILDFQKRLEIRLAQARSGARVIGKEALKRSKEQLERLEELFEDGFESASAEFVDTLHAWLAAEERSEAAAETPKSSGSEAEEEKPSPEEQAKRRAEELEAKKKAIEERLTRAASHIGGAVIEVAEAARLHFSELEGDLIDGLDALTKTASDAMDQWRSSKGGGRQAPKSGESSKP